MGFIVHSASPTSRHRAGLGGQFYSNSIRHVQCPTGPAHIITQDFSIHYRSFEYTIELLALGRPTPAYAYRTESDFRQGIFKATAYVYTQSCFQGLITHKILGRYVYQQDAGQRPDRQPSATSYLGQPLTPSRPLDLVKPRAFLNPSKLPLLQPLLSIYSLMRS